MAAGDVPVIGRAARQKIDEAVRAAERETGLQFCVYLGPLGGDPRRVAEEAFVRAGLQARPAVLLVVAPDQHKVEIVTAPDARERLPDYECADAMQEMTPHFAQGNFVEGLLVGIRGLAARAEPGQAPPDAGDLPNILD